MNRLDRRLSAVVCTVRMLLGLQIRFENRFQYNQSCRLDDAVFDRRNSERTLLPIGFRYVYATHGLGLVLFRSQFLRQFGQPLRHAILLDVLKGLAIYTWGAAIDEATPPSGPQHVFAVNLVVQRVEAEIWRFLRFGVQRCL